MVYIGVVAVMTALCAWLVVRRSMIGNHRDKEITAALAALSIALLFSLPSTNDPVDQALGGVGVVNTFSHCLICLCGWFMARGFFASSAETKARWSRGWGALILGVGGVIACWLISAVILDMPRVVHESPLSGLYWTFTLITYVLMLFPSLRAPGKVIRWLSGRGERLLPRWGVVTSYVVASVAYLDITVGLIVLWIVEVTPEPHLVHLREVMVYLGPLLLLLALLLCPVSTRFSQRARPVR